MTLTWPDCLALFLAATCSYVAGYFIFLAAGLVVRLARFRWHKAGHDRIVAYLQAHPRYPFDLPVVETHAAGEYICEECGTRNFFSLIQLSPEQLPPGRLREDARQVLRTVADDAEGGRGVSERGGVYQAPLVLQCRRCRALLANGDAADMFGPEQGGDHEAG